jgi:hypothetical protein
MEEEESDEPAGASAISDADGGADSGASGASGSSEGISCWAAAGGKISAGPDWEHAGWFGAKKLSDRTTRAERCAQSPERKFARKWNSPLASWLGRSLRCTGGNFISGTNLFIEVATEYKLTLKLSRATVLVLPSIHRNRECDRARRHRGHGKKTILFQIAPEDVFDNEEPICLILHGTGLRAM